MDDAIISLVSQQALESTKSTIVPEKIRTLGRIALSRSNTFPEPVALRTRPSLLAWPKIFKRIQDLFRFNFPDKTFNSFFNPSISFFIFKYWTDSWFFEVPNKVDDFDEEVIFCLILKTFSMIHGGKTAFKTISWPSSSILIFRFWLIWLGQT